MVKISWPVPFEQDTRSERVISVVLSAMLIVIVLSMTMFEVGKKVVMKCAASSD